MSTYVSVVISPETRIRPVFTSVSQATRPAGSSASTASRTPSEIWSAILSGWPSVTDSEVKRNSLSDSGRVVIRRGSLAAPRRLEVDDQRDPVQAVPLAQAGLEEVRVVARHQAAGVDLHGEARRAGFELGHVVNPQPPAPPRGRPRL